MPAIVTSAVIGFLLGPVLHHLAVQAGADAPFAMGEATCRRCGTRTGSPMRTCSSCGLGPTRLWVASLATAGVAAATAWRLGGVWSLGAYLMFVGLTVSLFITDIDHKRIPNRITYPGIPAAALLLSAGAYLDGNLSDFTRALLAALVYAAFFFLVYLAARGGFGFGDVKLAVLLGLFLGYLGWDRLLVAGFLTAAIGGLIALAAVVGKGAGPKTEIPYGPAMILGAWATVIGGQPVANLFL